MANRWFEEGDIGGLRKEIDGVKKVYAGYLDEMVGKAKDHEAELREKHREREEMVYYVFWVY